VASPSGVSGGGTLLSGIVAARLEHHFHAEDAQQLQQPIGADLVGIALEGGKRLLRDAQARGEVGLGESGLFPEGPEQERQLLGRSDGVLAHGTLLRLFSQKTAYMLLPRKTQQGLYFSAKAARDKARGASYASRHLSHDPPTKNPPGGGFFGITCR
jgi:hypothetical protein